MSKEIVTVVKYFISKIICKNTRDYSITYFYNKTINFLILVWFFFRAYKKDNSINTGMQKHTLYTERAS